MHYSFDKPKWNRVDLPNVPIFNAKLSQRVVNKLWEYVEKSKEDEEKNNQNKTLAGNISTSLTLHDEDDFFMKEVLKEMAENYINPNFIGLKWWKAVTSHAHFNISLSSFWVNFQRKHEFNPVHDHSGVLSFVVWLKIPTHWKDQHRLPISANSNSPVSSNFQFLYSDIVGNICTYDLHMSKEMENMIFMFPSQLKHSVYPFFECDEDRISLSGNLSFDSTSYIEWKRTKNG
jgi:hypothetical protein